MPWYSIMVAPPAARISDDERRLAAELALTGARPVVQAGADDFVTKPFGIGEGEFGVDRTFRIAQVLVDAGDLGDEQQLVRLQRDRGAEGTWRGYWSFTYLDATGQLGDQGFTLTHSNLGILRLADGHGATAR